MIDEKTDLDKYLEMTGQSFGDLMQGASTFGPSFIENELVPRALKEKKIIVWLPRLVDGKDVGLADYKLQDL